MLAIRKAPLAVVCLLLVALAGCNRQVSTNDFLPSSPAFQDALRIVLAALSVPADGSSTVRVEAQISPDADTDKRTVRFHTTLGTWVEPGSDADKGSQTDVPADEAGKAAAFLKSATTVGVALVTVSVITKDADGNVSTLATVTGEVTFTQVQDALELTVTPTSTFADGVSPITVEARISADSPVEWNAINFKTDAGVFDDNGSRTLMDVPTDSQRIARAQLTSVAVETGTVTATISQFPGSTVSQLIAFDQRNPDVVQIGTSAATIPADGASEISVFADIATGLDDRVVTFTSTGGEFIGGTGVDKRTITATPDASNRATVRLKADKMIREVLLKAQVTLNDKSTLQSSDTLIDFIRALPDFIEVTASPSPADQVTDSGKTTVTAVLTRDIGDVSPNTVVSYTVTESDGSAIVDIEFEDIKRSSEVGGVQTSTAVMNFSAATLPMAGNSVLVRASVAGSGAMPGEVSVLLTP